MASRRSTGACWEGGVAHADGEGEGMARRAHRLREGTHERVYGRGLLECPSARAHRAQELDREHVRPVAYAAWRRRVGGLMEG
ncbi:hypothetical protein AB1Y20_018263 [Prymnesium parvum]|uniref:Uncharacterized protein n=1 Tax=Prymnesium parvum TaxID=97485 RepID=A0AB34JQ61_PRYPA